MFNARVLGLSALIGIAGSAFAEDKPAVYHIVTTATQFNESDNTYTFQVRFISNPCPAITYDITLVRNAKDSDEAIAEVQPLIDKIASDSAKDQEKRCR